MPDTNPMKVKRRAVVVTKTWILRFLSIHCNAPDNKNSCSNEAGATYRRSGAIDSISFMTLKIYWLHSNRPIRMKYLHGQ